MVKFLNFLLLFAFAATVFCAPSKHSLWKNVKALNELIQVLQNNSNNKKGVSLLQNTLKTAATTGIMLGAINVEKQMEQNILRLLNEFYRNLQNSNMKAATRKMREIETSMERDQHAIEILKSSMDVALKTKNVREYRQALKKVASDKTTRNKQENLTSTKEIDKKKINELQANVISHLFHIRDKVNKTVQEVMTTMKSKQKPEKSSTSITITSQATHMNDFLNRDIVQLPHYYFEMPSWPAYEFDLESFYRFRRQNKNKNENDEKGSLENQVENSKESEGEEFEDALAPPSNNGGLAGLIASLSGGEGGSDVGALVGAISGVVTNLFGPGGLDIPSLLSTGTSLIAGLLGGDENFGKVLGSYIGIAVEGLSGGGGAVSFI